MPHFPQLASGAVSQYPVTVRRIVRTVVNQCADGNQYKNADAGASRAEWDFRLRALSPVEWQAIQDIFTESEGRLGTFTFLDPFDNLLVHSEDFAQAIWQKDAGLSVTSSRPDPWGSTRASLLTNGTGLARQLKQVVAAPGSFRYCLSLMARADSPATLRLRVDSVTKDVALNTAWQAFDLFADPGSPAAEVLASIELGAGASADIAALQLEAQLAPSSYKKTGAHAGVYTNARFASDQLLQTATDVDQHDTILRITAPWER